MSEAAPTPPKAFISYSWSNTDHEAEVLDLARDLSECGVEVILDKWDLREGQDTNAFMEQMVTDQTITKVIIVSDRAYAEKSDSRSGGAGTEAQIISPQLYAGQGEGKFLALVFERNDEGDPFLPVYYTSRLYIDFTDPSRRTDRFEQLVRWIFDKPLHKKPKVGAPPSYITASGPTIEIATSAAHRRALDALQNAKSHAFSAVQDYFDRFTKELPAFRITPDVDVASDKILENFDAFKPYRNEVIELIRATARGPEEARFGNALHSFFERFLPFFRATPDSGRYREFDFDNYRFFARELFLYASSILVEEGRLDLLDVLLGKPYYDHVRAEYGGLDVTSYVAFDYSDRLLTARSSNLQLNLTAPDISLLKERSVGTGIRFEQIMEMDLVLYLRSYLLQKQMISGWYPSTLAALDFGHRAFPVFARAQSKRELTMLLRILGIESRAPLDELLRAYADKEIKAPYIGRGWYEIDIPRLTGFSELGTQT